MRFYSPTILILRVSLFLLVLLLSGCFSPYTVRSAHPFKTNLEKQPAAERGYLSARLISNYNGFPQRVWHSLYITPASASADEKILYEVPIIHGGEDRSRFFFGILPPGQYAISRFNYSIPRADIVGYAPAPATLGTFSIVPGRVTDLSALIYQPYEFKGLDIPFTITRDNDGLDLFAQIEFNFPQLAEQIARDRVFGWNQESVDSSESDNQALLKVSLDLAVANGRVVAVDDQVVALTNLGVILVRDEKRQWHSYDTGYRLNLGDLKQLKDHSFLISAEFGYLLHSKSLTGPWQLLKSPLPAAQINQIHIDPAGGVYLATRLGIEKPGFLSSLDGSISRDNRFHIFYSPELLESAWQELKIPDDFDEFSSLSADQDNLYISSSGRDVLRYNFIEKQWDTVSYPYHQFVALEDGGQISYPSNYTDKHNTLVLRDTSSDAWVRPKFFMDQLPLRAPDGRWFILARDVISIAEGNRESLSSRNHHLYYLQPPDYQAVKYGPAYNECKRGIGTNLAQVYFWHRDELLSYCPEDDTVRRFDPSQQIWVDERHQKLPDPSTLPKT